MTLTNVGVSPLICSHCAGSAKRHTGSRGGTHLGGFLHLVPDVDLPELLEEAEHGQLQALVPGLSEPRVGEVHQLEHPEESETQNQNLNLGESGLWGRRCDSDVPLHQDHMSNVLMSVFIQKQPSAWCRSTRRSGLSLLLIPIQYYINVRLRSFV